MKSTSSGSGLRSVLAIASTPRSATSRRRISASISCCSWLRAIGTRHGRDAARSPTGLAVFVLLLLEQPFEHTIDVEVPQRAVQVVGAADRRPGSMPATA